MSLRYTALFFCLTLLSSAHGAPKPKPGRGCTTAQSDLVAAPVEKSDTSYKVTDRNFPDFHLTGVLSPEGKLTLSTYRELSNGDRATFPLGPAMRDMLDHFGDKVTSVELKLSQFSNIDEMILSKDGELDRFNAEWTKASRDPKLIEAERMVGERANRNRKIAARAALATELGSAVLFRRSDLQRVELKQSMGRDGKFVAVEVSFSRP